MLYCCIKLWDSEPSLEGFLLFNPNNMYQMIRRLISNYTFVTFISKKGNRSNNVQIQNVAFIIFPNFSTVSITPSTNK